MGTTPSRLRSLLAAMLALTTVAIQQGPLGSTRALAATSCQPVSSVEKCPEWLRNTTRSRGATAISPTGDRVFTWSSDCQDTTIKALDGATGAGIWTKTYTFGWPIAGVCDLVVSPDGRTVYAVGRVEFPSTWYDVVPVAGFLVEAMSASTGALLWHTIDTRETGRPGDCPQAAYYSAAISPDGSTLYAAGVEQAVIFCPPPEPSHGYLAALSTGSGAVIWTEAGIDGRDGRVVVSPDGGELLVEEIRSDLFIGTFGNPIIQPVRSNGSSIGLNPIVLPGAADDQVAGMSIDAHHNVYVSTTGSGGQFIRAYDSSSSGLWAAPVPGTSIAGMAVSTTPRVFVAANDSGPAGRVLGYDGVTGAELWSTPIGPDLGFAGSAVGGIGVGPGDRVYVGGATFGPSGLTNTQNPGYQLTSRLDGTSGRLVWRSRYPQQGSDTYMGRGFRVTRNGSRVFAFGGDAFNGYVELFLSNGCSPACLPEPLTTLLGGLVPL